MLKNESMAFGRHFFAVCPAPFHLAIYSSLFLSYTVPDRCLVGGSSSAWPLNHLKLTRNQSADLTKARLPSLKAQPATSL